MTKAIEFGSDSPIYFGELSKKKFNQINQILANNNLPLLEGRNIFIYPNVINKLSEKRVQLNKLSPDIVADIAFSAIHNKNSKVLTTAFPHIQSLVKVNNLDISNIAFIGNFNYETSVKSIYKIETKRIKNTLGGPASPPSA